jgi:hypothetical protein
MATNDESGKSVHSGTDSTADAARAQTTSVGRPPEEGEQDMRKDDRDNRSEQRPPEITLEEFGGYEEKGQTPRSHAPWGPATATLSSLALLLDMRCQVENSEAPQQTQIDHIDLLVRQVETETEIIRRAALAANQLAPHERLTTKAIKDAIVGLLCAGGGETPTQAMEMTLADVANQLKKMLQGDRGDKIPHTMHRDDLRILRALDGSPQSMVQEDIAAATDISRRTLYDRLHQLRNDGLTWRPHGERSGEALTAKGLALLQGLPPSPK